MGGVRCVVRDASQAYADARICGLVVALVEVGVLAVPNRAVRRALRRAVLELVLEEALDVEPVPEGGGGGGGGGAECEEERARRRCGACALYSPTSRTTRCRCRRPRSRAGAAARRRSPSGAASRSRMAPDSTSLSFTLPRFPLSGVSHASGQPVVSEVVDEADREARDVDRRRILGRGRRGSAKGRPPTCRACSCRRRRTT